MAVSGVVAAHAQTKVVGDYRISFAGILLASAQVTLDLDARSYDADISMEPSGLGSIVTAIRTRIEADGAIRRDNVEPRNYFVEARDSKKGVRVTMSMRGGSVRGLDAKPPLKAHPQRVEVRAGDKRGITDPLSSGLMPYPASAGLGPAACNRTLKIFDGWTRYDVKLSYRRMEQVSAGDYVGPAAVCGARWVPISGHREGRKEVEYLRANKGLEASLIPIPGHDFLFPYRISIQTRNGRIDVQARTLKVTGSNVRG